MLMCRALLGRVGHVGPNTREPAPGFDSSGVSVLIEHWSHITCDAARFMCTGFLTVALSVSADLVVHHMPVLTPSTGDVVHAGS
jgi:hypothetical protein